MDTVNRKTAIQKFLADSGQLKLTMAETMTEPVEKMVELFITALKGGHKILMCGNGGSAADAQHFAAEFVNRYKIDRAPWPALALHTDTSALTSIGNDSGFDFVFSKQVEAFGQAGDILVVITTSDISRQPNGHSTNICRALEVAKAKGLTRVGLVSQKSKDILSELDLAIAIPHTETSRIQEGHITIIHAVSELVELALA